MAEIETVRLENAGARTAMVLVCEHASAVIPPDLNGLGLAAADRESHAAWDPGAFGVAQGLAARLDAVLVAGGVSRLVYDCNRPPEAPGAILAQSERISIPGNRALDAGARADRVARFYEPFRAALAQQIAQRDRPAIVTIHSFTRVYHGRERLLDIGVLHDADTRLADAMLEIAPEHTSFDVRRNDPYGPQDGVTHTLKEHALPAGLPNVMIEIRNDLIADASAQDAMAGMLAGWIVAALQSVEGRADA